VATVNQAGTLGKISLKIKFKKFLDYNMVMKKKSRTNFLTPTVLKKHTPTLQ
jgi:hypothetical protein